MSLMVNSSITLIFWSSAFVGVRYVVQHYDPFEFAFLRLVCATVTIALIAKLSGQKFLSIRQSFPFAITGLLGATLYFCFLNIGQMSLGAAESSVVINTIPIFTALLAYIFLKQKLKFHVWIGLVISLAGMALIALANKPSAFELNHGALWVMGSAICTAASTLIQKNLLEKYSPATAILYTNLYGSLFALPIGWNGLVSITQIDIIPTLVLVYLGVFPAGIACYFWLKILKEVQASKAVTLLYFIPVLTCFLAYFILGEKLTPMSFVGASITMLGIILSQSSSPKLLPRFILTRFVSTVIKRI